jgi:hypothetical protein
MNETVWQTAGALLAVVVIGGCGSSAATNPDCEAGCTASNACPGANMVDCSSVCAKLESSAAAAGCSSQFDAEQAWLAHLSNGCNQMPCMAQIDALSTCSTGGH